MGSGVLLHSSAPAVHPRCQPLLTKTAAPICHTHGGRLREKRAGGEWGTRHSRRWSSGQSHGPYPAIHGWELQDLLSISENAGYSQGPGELEICSWLPLSLSGLHSHYIFQLINIDSTYTLWLSSYEAFLCFSLLLVAISSSGGQGGALRNPARIDLFNTFFQSNLRKEFSSSSSFFLKELSINILIPFCSQEYSLEDTIRRKPKLWYIRVFSFFKTI